MPLTLGKMKLHAIHDGTYALDGGALFGVVPRVLWERQLPPDAHNRVKLAVRCLLIDDGQRRILVDDGIGLSPDDKHRALYAIDQSETNLDKELQRAGYTRDDITDVVLTHLHFDHAGGTTRHQDGQHTLAFPRATWHLQRRNWKWAHQPSDKDAGAFVHETFAPLERSGRLHLLEGGTELYPGVELFVCEGHTVGLQLVRVTGGEQTVLFCGDVIPTHAHLKPAWVMAYDLYPLTTIEEKKLLLAEAVENGTLLFFEHDPHIAACTVREEDGNVVVDKVVPL